ncbi:MAG: UDP-3-O-acyl-N-acetylglucosamine deacetylase [Planctomycetota bacterium]|nr:UDP-3-O-acyl-N-acetylglucosamine deacetylase [Planctomycetota bacterium]
MIAQRTLAAPARIEGVGLHLGKEVHAELLPAPAASGITFVRTDLEGWPRVRACLENLGQRPRRTALVQGRAEVHTVEHLLASLWALGIQNLEVRIDGPELPGLDGSSLPFYEALKAAGSRDQDVPSREIHVARPVGVSEEGAHIVALEGASGLKVSYTLDYDSPALGTQFFSVDLDEETFVREIAPARTFVLEEEARALQAAGLGKGASTENTLVLGRDGRVIGNELRFENEFVRHKILDLIGDLYLMNSRLNAQIVATKSGHSLNVRLAQSLAAGAGQGSAAAAEPPYGYRGPLGIDMIERILPHRYPFLLVDRVEEVAADGRYARGVKSVTANEGFFRGHFPGRPVMPGVLQVEALAQLAGILLLSHKQNAGRMAHLLSMDSVKFRRQVVPGDQLVLEANLKSMKKRTAQVLARATVDGALSAEALIRFALVRDD